MLNAGGRLRRDRALPRGQAPFRSRSPDMNELRVKHLFDMDPLESSFRKLLSPLRLDGEGKEEGRLRAAQRAPVRIRQPQLCAGQ
jgi:hypothetical protein